MAKNFEHVSHIKSKLPKENINPEEFYGLTPTVDNSDAEGSSPIKVKFPKLPTKDNLIEGEIAVNYLKGHETLSIKNTENENRTVVLTVLFFIIPKFFHINPKIFVYFRAY